MTQNTTVMVFTNQLEAIRKQPRKVQKDLMAAMLCFLAFGEQPDFSGMVLRNKQLAESVWMLMLPVLERSRRLRCTDCPRADAGGHTRARAEEEKEIEEEREVEVKKESEERNLSSSDANASVSSAPADDVPEAVRTERKNDENTRDTSVDAGGTAPVDAGGTASVDAGGTAPVDAGGTAPVDAGGVASPCGMSDGAKECDASTGPKQPRLKGEELYEAVRDYFNTFMQGRGIPEIKSLRGKRRRTLDARFREYGSDAVAEVIRKASDSRFLNGDNRNSFVASFDWMMRPANFIKIWDGNYDDR